MFQPVRFVLGRGAAAAAAPRTPASPSQPVVAKPTASARRAAAQPRHKRKKPQP